MTVSETDLPGVGKKHEIDLDGDETLVVLTHNTGRREVFRRPEADADVEKLFELSDRLARTVGTVLEGAYFQPTGAGDATTTLAGGTVLEWVTVPASSPVVGDGDAVPDGVSVLAVQRGDELLTGSPPATTLEAGDVLVVAGSADACRSFAARVRE